MTGKYVYAITRRIGYDTIEFMTDRIKLDFQYPSSFNILGFAEYPEKTYFFENERLASQFCRALNCVTQSLTGISLLETVDYNVFSIWLNK